MTWPVSPTRFVVEEFPEESIDFLIDERGEVTEYKTVSNGSLLTRRKVEPFVPDTERLGDYEVPLR